ncbi:MAG: hypothetical protein Q4D88_02525 [Anaerococcus sp.]|nr:hypothetical protein [Anaerococcus sp.]
MAGLINLLSQYSSRLLLLPIVSLIIVGISIMLYFINDRKIVKFIPSLGIGILALVLGIIAIFNFTSNFGLNLAWIAVFLGTGALIGIITCFIIDLVDSIRNNYGYIETATSKSKGKNIKKERIASKKHRK